MVPTRGEAAYLRPEGRKPYFIGQVPVEFAQFVVAHHDESLAALAR